MSFSNLISKSILCVIILAAIDYLPTYAQKTRVTIIKETYDENGNKQVETIVKEGAEAEALDLDNLSKPSDSDIQWQHFGLDSSFTKFFGQWNQTFDFDALFDSLPRSLGDGLGFQFFDNFGDRDNLMYKPKLGVQIKALENQAGVVVMHVLHDTPADRAGLKEGDIILALDDNKVNSHQDVVEYIQSLQPEDEVLIDVMRDKEYIQLTATLTEYKGQKELEIRKL